MRVDDVTRCVLQFAIVSAEPHGQNIYKLTVPVLLPRKLLMLNHRVCKQQTPVAVAGVPYCFLDRVVCSQLLTRLLTVVTLQWTPAADSSCLRPFVQQTVAGDEDTAAASKLHRFHALDVSSEGFGRMRGTFQLRLWCLVSSRA